MELNAITDAFDRVCKRQKLSSSKTEEIIDHVVQEVEQALVKLQSAHDTSSTVERKTVFTDLKTKLNEIGSINQLEGLQKELNVALSKYTKLIDKTFIADISKAYKKVDFDSHTVNQIIATHFYRQGMFELGDCFVNEAHESEVNSLRSSFLEMYRILEAVRSRNLEPAVTWVAANRDRLLQNGSRLELNLHRQQFVEILQNGSQNDALKYGRTHLSQFASTHITEIQKLMSCLLWVGRLDHSPYAELLSATYWEKLAEEFIGQFCCLLGQPYKSPLTVAIEAGIQGLPTLLKLANVMAAKQQEWQEMKQLPVPVDLGRDFQFHSIFVCPVSRDQATQENLPMLMPCGHVLCKQSIVKLSKNSNRAFKCPYCPFETTLAQCRHLYF